MHLLRTDDDDTDPPKQLPKPTSADPSVWDRVPASIIMSINTEVTKAQDPLAAQKAPNGTSTTSELLSSPS